MPAREFRALQTERSARQAFALNDSCARKVQESECAIAPAAQAERHNQSPGGDSKRKALRGDNRKRRQSLSNPSQPRVANPDLRRRVSASAIEARSPQAAQTCLVDHIATPAFLWPPTLCRSAKAATA